MDRIYGFPASAKHYHLYTHDSEIKRHPAYLSAKQGDKEAALELVWELASKFLYRLRGEFSDDIVYVSPFAREAAGDNAIPPLLASACANLVGGQAENDIVQVERVYHTGADPMERMSLRPSFEGEVILGQPYVLVDDLTNMGGTLAELANYILINGGSVKGTIVLCNAGRSHDFLPERRSCGCSTRGLAMKSKTFLVSEQRHLPQTKPTTLLVSDRLTRSEIDLLRQKKKQLNDYGLKAFREKMRESGMLNN